MTLAVKYNNTTHYCILHPVACTLLLLFVDSDRVSMIVQL